MLPTSDEQIRSAADTQVLQRNTGRQAAVLNIVRRARATLGDSLAAMSNGPVWKRFVRDVAEVVRTMPLWKLQNVGREHLEFLYANTGAGNTITLRLTQSSIEHPISDAQPAALKRPGLRSWRSTSTVVRSNTQGIAGNLTGLPPSFMLRRAASMKANISSVSSCGTGGSPVLKNLTISATSAGYPTDFKGGLCKTT